MKNFFFLVVLASIFTNCKQKKTPVFLDKNHSLKYFLFEGEIPNISYKDSTSNNGIYDVFLFQKRNGKIDVKKAGIKSYFADSRFEKVAFYADANSVIEVPASYDEGKAIGSEYDYDFPCKISVYTLESNSWLLLKQTDIGNYEAFKKLVFETKKELLLNSMANSKIDDFWYNEYDLWLSSYNPSYNYIYQIKVSKDTSYIKERLLNDLLIPYQNKDTLFLYYKKNLLEHFVKDESQPELTIVRHDGDFYIKSQLFDLKNSISDTIQQYGFLVNEIRKISN